MKLKLQCSGACILGWVATYRVMTSICMMSLLLSHAILVGILIALGIALYRAKVGGGRAASEAAKRVESEMDAARKADEANLLDKSLAELADEWDRVEDR